MKLFDVCAIQRGCVYDGSGVRTTIFFRGCSYNCPWCCNPEALNTSPNYFIDNDKCLKYKSIQSKLCENCERYGGKEQITSCIYSVAELSFHTYTVERLLETVLVDRELFYSSCGGITLSGGEPALYANELLLFLKALKEKRINCAIETTLYIRNKKYITQLIPYIDEWIIDLKLQDIVYKEDYTDILLMNLNELRNSGCSISYRLVSIKGLYVKKISERLTTLGIMHIQVLKCHSLAKSKYLKLGIEFKDYSPSDEEYINFVKDLRKEGFEASMLSI